MQISPAFRKHLIATIVLVLILGSSPRPAFAVSKEIVELQTQVQQLLDNMQRLQSTMDTRFGVLQHLAEQTADEANQMTAAVNALQKKIDAESDATNGKLDTASGQVQSLNDSIDELKSRLAKLDKTMQDLQSQLQTMQAQQPQAPPPGTQPQMQAPAPGALPPGAGPTNAPVPSPQAPPLQETYQAGVRDFNAARYDVALGEFQDVAHYYPLDDMAGAAQFYIGEIAYQHQNYADAINAYNIVLEGFSGSPKAPAAQLHKGFALLAMNKKEAGVHELRLLIQRHPQSPEAARARTKLNGMGVKVAVH
jgi:TolA-binding protein